VRELGAVQSQDYPAAGWALGLRVGGLTQRAADETFDGGEILRTHVLRPTWHFVHRDDVRWMLELTGPRIRGGLGARHRFLGLDRDEILRAQNLITRALRDGGPLTRAQAAEALRAGGLAIHDQRVPHLLMVSELDGLVTSGPLSGRQQTWMLLDERAPGARSLPREEAVAELALRYFKSHGPAGLEDFRWWSGLPLQDGRAGVEAAGRRLERTEVEGRPCWFDPAAEPPSPPAAAGPELLLLPNFDEYAVAYRDRSALLPEGAFDPARLRLGLLSNIVVSGGRVRGTWRRTFQGAALQLEVQPIDRFGEPERLALAAAAQRLGAYAEREVRLRIG
jgi:hypothetical protein